MALGGAAFYPGDVPGKAALGLCVPSSAAQIIRLVRGWRARWEDRATGRGSIGDQQLASLAYIWSSLL